MNWIDKSKFVLDGYHLNKYMKAAIAHLKNRDIYQGLKDAIEWPDKEMLKKWGNSRKTC